MLGQAFKPGRDGPTGMDVLTDDYTRVTCRENQVKAIKRRGDTRPFSEKPGGDRTKVYDIERDNILRLEEAIWHDHYQKCGFWPGGYAKTWESGDIKPSPKDEDIRQLPSQFDEQIPLPLGV